MTLTYLPMGLTQRVPFERLKDPEAIANWPETQGRDGARTPMPWRSEAANAGFSQGERMKVSLARALVRREKRKTVGRAAFLKRPGCLQRVQLEPNIGAGEPADCVTVNYRRSNNCTGDPLRCRGNILIRNHRFAVTRLTRDDVNSPGIVCRARTGTIAVPLLRMPVI